MRRMTAMAALLGLAAAAQAAGPLKGAWQAVAARHGPVDAPDLVGHVITFNADRFTITQEGRPLYAGPYSVAAGDPARIELSQEEGADLRGTWLGIWRIDGDLLTICDNAPDMSLPAPADWEACLRPGYVVVSFARQGV